jgi:hypothetical protein
MRIHVENQHYKNDEVLQDNSATAWAVHLVLRLQDADPLNTQQQQQITEYFTASVDTGITALDLDADPDIPYLSLYLDLQTVPSDETSLEDEDRYISDREAENIRKEAALAKGIVASLGALVRIDVPTEIVELEVAHVVEIDQLSHDRREIGPGLFGDNDRYEENQLAHSVFRDEVEMYQDLMELSQR